MSTNTDQQPALASHLPEKLNPTGAPVEGGLGPTQVVPRDEGTAAAVLRDLATIGEHVQGADVRRVTRGRALVNQQRLDAMMRELAAVVMEMQQKRKKTRRDLTSMAQLSHAFGYLSARLTDSQHLMLEVEKVSSPGGTDAPKVLHGAFPAGAIVQPSPGAMMMKPEGQTRHGDQPTGLRPGA